VAATAKVRVERTPKPGDLACKPDKLESLSARECLRRFKEARILAVRGQDSGPAEPIMGIPMEYVSFAEVNDAWKAADKDESRAVADRWQKGAAAVVDVSRETLETSAAMYLGMKAVLEKHGANAITVNCLGGFYGGHIHAYPCLGFHELNNEALVGACECDVRSTATMVALTTLTQGRPGYISDPVIDTSKRQIIYAHCVASNKAFGPKGEANKFEILTHSEDRQGASVRSVLPLGYMTTTVEFDQGRKEVLFHRGKAVENDPDDRACRTKLAVEPVGDIEKLFGAWDQWGWHRVTCSGDLKEPIYSLADALGWKVVEEA
jgi:L-fucose isomerase-like protein